MGQTTENFGTRVGRHLRGEHSDTLAYRILDPFEVAEMELWPLEEAPSDLEQEDPAHLSEAELPELHRFDLVSEGLRED